MALSTTVKSIQDIMRQDAGVDGDAQRISQLTWIFFLKIFDAKEEEYELTNRKYRSPIPKGLEYSEADDPRGYVVQAVFEEAVNFMKSGQLLRQVINKIEGIDFHNQKERHLFNDIYETILRDLQSAGNAGEYYTPRAVTQFITDMTAPKLGELVMDPACGTGGFLACSIEALRKQVSTAKEEATLQNSIRASRKSLCPTSSA